MPATLRFATACAQCHEGECSGRLTFATAPESAFTHIRQYAGPTDDTLARELYAALKQMKSDCRYGDLHLPDLAGPLAGPALDSYRDPWTGAYFLPLEGLAPGRYRLTVDVERAGLARLELIDAAFDPLIDHCLTVGQAPTSVIVTLVESPRHFLRLSPRGGLRVRTLTLTPAP